MRSEYAGSYVIERSGGEIYGGLKQISGAVYMIRRDVLEEIGWETSITEDFQLTLKLYEKGYKVVYTPYIQAPAECVSTLKRLIRQRMRWAEGHSNNVRRMFVRLMVGKWEEVGSEQWAVNSGQKNTVHRTPNTDHKRVFTSSPLTLSEKLEFLYLSPYYLQAFFFLIGTFSWLISETIFATRLPFWTSLWGWSLVLTNLLALPLMNSVGLFLEESEERDYQGIASFVALSYILVPFQAYAAVKGFLEKTEGPWFRTPKTGRITDVFTRGRFYRFISGILPGRATPSVVHANTLRMGTARMNSNISINSHNFNSPANSYLSLATANSQFNSFKIKPKGYRFIGNLVLIFALISSLGLSYFGTNIKTGSLADLPIQTRVEKTGEKGLFLTQVFKVFSPQEVLAATEKAQGVFVSGVKQISMETLIASSGLALLIILVVMINIYKRKKTFFKKAVKLVFVFSLIFSWLLSGWPVIWPLGELGVNTIRIPPKIQEAQAAIAVDATSQSATVGNSGSSMSWSHTVGSGSNRILIVLAHARDTVTAGDTVVSGITYGGVGLTQAVSVVQSTTNVHQRTSLWYLVNPTAGAATIAITWTADCNFSIAGSAVSLTGVDQTNPIDATNTALGTGTPVTVNVTTVADNAWVVDSAMNSLGATWTIGAGQTTIENRSGGTSVDQFFASYEGPKTPPGAVTMSWTGSGTDGWASVAASFKPAPLFTQSAYRFFNNNTANSTDVGSALATQDTAASLTSDGQDFRLRLLVHVSDAQLALNGQNFKLQIAVRSGTCDTGFVGEAYSDLATATGDIRYFNDTDTAKTDGADLTANASDPTHAADTIRNQDYEEANNFTNTVAAIAAGEDGKWDFSIVDFSGADNTTYCLRVVESGGTVLTTYTVIPEFTTVPENPILLFGLYPLLAGMLKRFRKKGIGNRV